MNVLWVVVFVVIAVGAILYTRTISEERAASSSTLTFPQTVGAGVIGLGILLIAMPWAASASAAFDFVASSDFSILTGADYVIGVIAILAGVALLTHRDSPE